MEPPPPSGVKARILDVPLHGVGFQFVEITPHKITGRLPVTEKCCQPFKVLHGGVSALIAESLASMGAHMASGFGRVAGVHLSIHHLKSAHIGDVVFAEAAPVNIGKTIHVWEVCIWKIDPNNEENKTLIASSRVTLKANMSVPRTLPFILSSSSQLFQKSKLQSSSSSSIYSSLPLFHQDS